MKCPQRLLLITTAICLALPAAAEGIDTMPPTFLAQPIVSMNTNAAAPLTGRIQITSDEPVVVEVYVREATRSFRFQPTQTFATTHDLPLLGFRPGRPHRVNVAIRDAAGNRTVWPFGTILSTPALPANFPPLRATSTPSQMEPGFTLTGMRWSSPTVPGSGTYGVMLDPTGQVVWLYESPSGLRDITRMRNGNFLANANNRLNIEIDPFGNIVNQWWAARLGTTGAPAGAILVDCDSFHHENAEMSAADNGNFLALSTEMRTYPNYPTSEVDLTQTAPFGNVVGDVVIEFQRDGTLVREFKLLDVLDPYRLCYNSLAGFYSTLYGVLTFDWSHGNSIVVDPTDDTWVISLRNQDAVIKVRRSDNSLVWIHGAHERWGPAYQQYLLTPVGSPFEWQFHQHSPDIDAAGNMTLFDNGNYRVIPPVPAPPISEWYSRAVRYQIDPVAMTTTQVLEWTDAAPFFSGTLGDADPLPLTGNVLVTDGAKPAPGNRQYSRLVETRFASPGQQIVFEVVVNDPNGPVVNPYNWVMYRAERYRALYQ